MRDRLAPAGCFHVNITEVKRRLESEASHCWPSQISSSIGRTSYTRRLYRVQHVLHTFSWRLRADPLLRNEPGRPVHAPRLKRRVGQRGIKIYPISFEASQRNGHFSPILPSAFRSEGTPGCPPEAPTSRHEIPPISSRIITQARLLRGVIFVVFFSFFFLFFRFLE